MAAGDQSAYALPAHVGEVRRCAGLVTWLHLNTCRSAPRIEISSANNAAEYEDVLPVLAAPAHPRPIT